jgi:hypothetical protein
MTQVARPCRLKEIHHQREIEEVPDQRERWQVNNLLRPILSSSFSIEQLTKNFGDRVLAWSVCDCDCDIPAVLFLTAV